MHGTGLHHPHTHCILAAPAQVVDAFRASYGVENALYAVTQLAQVSCASSRPPCDVCTHASWAATYLSSALPPTLQTTMRSELGKIPLDSVFSERDTLNQNIVASIQPAAMNWGLEVLR